MGNAKTERKSNRVTLEVVLISKELAFLGNPAVWFS